MPKPLIVISHWNTMIQGLSMSPKEFSTAVEAAIKTKGIPNTKHSRIHWSEGGLLSAKREYLRIQRKEYAYDICGAPFGNGFFVSTWLGELPSGIYSFLSELPFGLSRLARIVRPQTYYRVDTANMFQSLVSSAVLQVIDDVVEAKGLRTLTEAERKPEMRSFFS